MIINNLNIGVRGHDINVEDLIDLADKCSNYGINSVQLVLKKSCKGFKEGMFSPSFAKYIGSIFDDKNLEIAVLGCYINPSCSDKELLKQEMDYFIENLKYARYMNAGVVGIETGFVGKTCKPEKNHTEEAYQYLLSNMKVLRDAAEKLGVTIAVEGVSSFVVDTPEKMHRLVTDLDSPNISVIFDPLNLLTIYNYDKQDELFWKMFDLLGDKISVIHLKDFNIVDNSLQQCPIGKGLLDIQKLLYYVKTKKPNIPIILEEVKEESIIDSIKKLNKY